jgi:ubiquinone/menaquinone biosynthesis C-methylase UbiE
MEKWWDGKGEAVLRAVGVKKGHVVLDFGCGSGNYTIPAAKIVGEKGVVYALDKNRRKLDNLMRRAGSHGLSNIIRIDTSGEIDTRLNDGSIDLILLYDVFWYFPIRDRRLPILLDELNRISKPDALLSVFPKHIDANGLKEKIIGQGFTFINMLSGNVLHDDRLEKGEIYNFKTKGTLDLDLHVKQSKAI